MTSPVTWVNVTSCTMTYDSATLVPSSGRLRHYAQYKLLVDVYVISTLCVVGFVGNVLSFGVLCSNRHERRGTTTCLLQTLAVVDTAYLFTCLIIQPIKVSGVARILSQEGHGVRTHEIRQKSHKFLHKYNKLENCTNWVYNSDCESVARTGNT